MDHLNHRNQTAKNRKLIVKKSTINIVSKFACFSLLKSDLQTLIPNNSLKKILVFNKILGFSDSNYKSLIMKKLYFFLSLIGMFTLSVGLAQQKSVSGTILYETGG